MKSVSPYKTENDKYSFMLDAPYAIDSLYAKMTDENGVSDEVAVKDLLVALGDKNEFAWESIVTDKWIFDKSAPSIHVSYEGNAPEEDSVFFGNDEGTVGIIISDMDSIKDKDLMTILITSQFKGVNDTSYSDAQKIAEESFSNNEKDEYSFEIDTVNDLTETGDYLYTITAVDYAGNKKTIEVPFYVDHSTPNGVIAVVSPEVKVLKYDGGINENWIVEDPDSKTVTFRVYPETNGSRIKTIEFKVNSFSKRYSYSPMKDEDDREYMQFSIKKSDVKYINGCYNVSAVIINRARNRIKSEYTLHIDTDNPVINSVKASKKNNALMNAINFLSFGTFFNDSIILSVTADDTSYGAGPDYAEFTYKNGTENLKSGKVYFSNEKSGEAKTASWDMNILEDEVVVSANVVVVVYDKLGKKSTLNQVISGENGESAGNDFVMLEKVKPVADVTIDSGDGAERSDGQIWYRKNHEVKLNFSDLDSGIREVFFSVNGKKLTQTIDGKTLATEKSTGTAKITSLAYTFTTEQIAEQVEMDKDGRYHIECYAVDNAGNQSVTAIKDYYRDVTAPVIKNFSFRPYTVDGIEESSEFIEELRYGFYFTDSAVVTALVDDTNGGTIPSSGNYKMYFKLVSYKNGKQDKVTTTESVIANNTAECVIPKNFKGQIYVKSNDMVGNISDEVTSYALVLDTDAPTIEIEPLPENAAGKDPDGNALYTDKVSFRVTVSDYQSGLREVVYSKKSELDSFDAVVTSIGDNYEEALNNGWEIVNRDQNLITEISKVFTFDKDDNSIQLSFVATDRSKNASDTKKNTPFTIDTIAPVVTITNPSTVLNGKYYQGSTSFTISVTERNFDPSLMVDTITNTYTSSRPTVEFSSTEGSNTHTAVVYFPEGDYDFTFTGTDLGGHVTRIYVNGSSDPITTFSTIFNVDATAPSISTNFITFNTDRNDGNYFKEAKSAEITITEHNFDEAGTNLRVESKSPGSSHDNSGWYEIGSSQGWTNSGDTHSISIPCSQDAVYRVSVNPKDLADNQGNGETSPIFEIDTTVPKLYSRNGVLSSESGFVTTPYSEVYDEKKKGAPAPNVEFEDNNFKLIKIEANIFRPEYTNGMEFNKIIPDKLSKDLTGEIGTKSFSVPQFDKDGVYSFTFTALDKAGNESEPINDTYFRLVDTDMLAYISNSSIVNHSGYYSLMDEYGRAISKKASDFSDLEISVITLNSDKKSGRIIVRDEEDKYSTDTHLKTESTDISKTAHIDIKTLPAQYFSETFRDDSLDNRMYLSISINDHSYLDLATIHIDNEPPSATLPEDFANWHNYLFTDSVVIDLTEISETLNTDNTKIYECPREDEREEIPYEYNKADKILSFTLDKGAHNIDIVLVDEAGNEWDVDRVRYLRVGNFRLYLILGGVVLIAGAVVVFFQIRKRKRHKTNK